MKPAVFFDRDGVVNESPGSGYVTRWEDFRFCPGIEAALEVCRDLGYLTIVVTSQRCVGKGLISESGLAAIHAKMQDRLRSAEDAPAFDAIYAFTGLPETEHWEKPKPGMIESAVVDFGIDLDRSWLIGDHDRDIAMAANAGIPNTIRVQSHHEIAVPAKFTVKATSELPELLRRVLLPGG